MTEQYPPASPEYLPKSPSRLAGQVEVEVNRPLLAEDDVSAHSAEAHDVAGEDSLTRFAILLVGCAAISGLLFGEPNKPRPILQFANLSGYDTGVISGTLVVIGSDLGRPLGDIEKVCMIIRWTDADNRK
jgi:hypothetical protein